MSLSCGVVGLPNVGKSTLFNALTQAGAVVANYPFCTIEPQTGVVAVSDPRLQELGRVLRPERLTPATLEVVDIAGLVRGASRGEGLGNQFLDHIRKVDLVLQVVRCFQDGNVSHVVGEVDPLRDLEIVQTEMALADMATVSRRREKTQKMVKTGEAKYRQELAQLDAIDDALSQGLPLPDVPVLGELFLLSAKPFLILANTSEEDQDLTQLEAKGPVIPIMGKIEAELAEMEASEARELREELGLGPSGLERVIQAAFDTLGLIRFYTVKGPETRAWSIPRGTRAPQAAGKIHSDMEQGFIRAEVISWQELVSHGGFAEAREKGRVRSEGKEYEIADGDVVLFRFNPALR